MLAVNNRPGATELPVIPRGRSEYRRGFMSPLAKKLVQKTLKRFNFAVTRYNKLERLNEGIQAMRDLALVRSLPEDRVVPMLRVMDQSKSQSRQDLFALAESGFKTGGYFVEFGASDGITLSNTWLMEKEFGWTGIVAEPGRSWHDQLKKNRSCEIETDCVWRVTGSSLTFNETTEGEFSAIDSFGSKHPNSKKFTNHYAVNTISLEDMLKKHKAPRKIDYLSMDTEGSEYEILSAFNFDHYEFGVVTVEHDGGLKRASLFDLLTGKGYVRKLEGMTGFDDWYVRT
jgi:FkbM family methyltransferase